MPLKPRRTFRRKRTFKRRNYAKRNRRSNLYTGPSVRTLVTRSDSLIADKVRAKLNYVEQGTLQSASGAITTIQFNQNNLFDPYYTGVGHQPRFRDQIATLYNRYRVYGVLVEITGVGGSGNGIVVTNAYPNDGVNASITNALTAIEMGLPHVKTLPGAPFKYKKYYSIAKVWGINKSRVRDDDVFSGQMAGAPSWRSYMDIHYQSLDGSSTTDVDYVLKLTYYCGFFSPVRIGDS